MTSSQLNTPGVFATPETNGPPAVVLRANELAAAKPTEIAGALRQLSCDPELLVEHLGSQSLASPRRFGPVDVPLAIAAAEVEQCESLDDVVALFNKLETRAALENPTLLRKILELPPGGPD